jgi:hypothetical protein
VKRTFPALLAVFAVGLLLATFSQADTDVSPETVKKLLQWQKQQDWSYSNKATIGESRFGYKHMSHTGGEGPRMDYWCKLLDTGIAHVWSRSQSDSNGNGQMDAGEGESFKYWFWYAAKVDVIFAWERSWTPQQWLEKAAQDIKGGAREVAIGDGAMAGSSVCCAIKGPVMVTVSIDLCFDNGDYLYIDNMGSWAVPYSDIVEKADLSAKLENYQKQKPDELVDLTKYIISTIPLDQKDDRVQKSQTHKPAVTSIAAKVGKPGIHLTASPAGLWADGKATSKISLVAIDAAGVPIAGRRFDIASEGGKLSHTCITTDAAGRASATYTATTFPGIDTITATGPSGETATTKVTLGGLALIPADQKTFTVMADGSSQLGIVGVCVGPDGKPLPGVKMKLSLDSKDFPNAGTLSTSTVVTGKNGLAALVYTPPDLVSNLAKLRTGDVYVGAVATVGKPARTVRATMRVTLLSGNQFFLEADKPGYVKTQKIQVSAPQKNGVVRGRVETKSPDGKLFPIIQAKLELIDGAGRLLGKTFTNTEGVFELEFVGEQTNPAECKVDLAQPVRLELDPDLVLTLKQWDGDLDTLAKRNYDVSLMRDFEGDFHRNLASSLLVGGRGVLSTEYLLYSAVRLPWITRYIKLLETRQAESIDWFTDSAKNLIECVQDLTELTDKVEAVAKTKLKERFASDAWKSFQEKSVVFLLKAFYTQFQKGVDLAKTMNADTDSLEDFNKFGIEFANKMTVTGLTDGLKAWFNSRTRLASQRALGRIANAALNGELPSTDPGDVIEKAKQIFTTYEKYHNELNIANLDRELYRLDFKLFVETVVKGPFVYLKLKSLASNAELVEKLRDLDSKALDKMQDDLIGTGNAITQVFAAIDAPFQAYQGYNWIADYYVAAGVREKLVETLTR